MIVLTIIVLLMQIVLIGMSILYNRRILDKYDGAIKSLKLANEKNNAIIVEKLEALNKRLSKEIKEQCITLSGKIKDFISLERKNVNKHISDKLTEVLKEIEQNFINTNNAIADHKISDKAINSLCEKIDTLNRNYGTYKDVNFKELMLNLAALSTSFNEYKKSHNNVVANINQAMDKSNDLLTNNKVNFDKIIKVLTTTETSVNRLVGVVDGKFTVKRKPSNKPKAVGDKKADSVKDKPATQA